MIPNACWVACLASLSMARLRRLQVVGKHPHFIFLSDCTTPSVSPGERAPSSGQWLSRSRPAATVCHRLRPFACSRGCPALTCSPYHWHRPTLVRTTTGSRSRSAWLAQTGLTSVVSTPDSPLTLIVHLCKHFFSQGSVQQPFPT